MSAKKQLMSDADLRKFFKTLNAKKRDGFSVSAPKGEKHSKEELAKAEISLRYMKCIAEKCTEEEFVTSLKSGDIPPVKLNRQDMAFVNGGSLTVTISIPGVQMSGETSDYQEAGQQIAGWGPIAFWQGPTGQQESSDFGECIVTYWSYWPWVWGS